MREAEEVLATDVLRRGDTLLKQAQGTSPNLLSLLPQLCLIISVNTLYNLLSHARTDLQAKAALRGGLDQLVDEEYRNPESIHYTWGWKCSQMAMRGLRTSRRIGILHLR